MSLEDRLYPLLAMYTRLPERVISSDRSIGGFRVVSGMVKLMESFANSPRKHQAGAIRIFANTNYESCVAHLLTLRVIVRFTHELLQRQAFVRTR